MTEYKLPELQYAHNEFEPVISEEIMKLHHTVHHQNYVNGLNLHLKSLEEPECNIGELIILINKDVTIEPKKKEIILFNAGGHYNHSFYWKCMSKTPTKPNIPLTKQMERDFGSFDEFKKAFLASTLSVFKIGWQFLCYDPKNKKLAFYSTEQHGTPFEEGLLPILACDLWEHAWYLKYKTNKKEFLTKWMDLINWDNVSVFYDLAIKNKIVDFLSDGNVDLFFGSNNSEKSEF
ncbi:Manganese superoxide dismutase [Pseudoloma neurophilia]|uniref:Superoxide dismutase n=1 Tax=Pseudoloma neurophilia TaxID=146866 RepID=A0A0R0M0T7_9MICR|nr:Manganese superoxide dismutase [Pseudoloma neurophilia]